MNLWAKFCIVRTQITFLTTFSPHVLHYGPLDGSKNKEEVFTYRHSLPDASWHEPSPTDPLSLIDQVKSSLKSS